MIADDFNVKRLRMITINLGFPCLDEVCDDVFIGVYCSFLQWYKILSRITRLLKV